VVAFTILAMVKAIVVLALLLLIGGCSGSSATTSSEAPGIAGSLSTTEGQLVDGQVLVWAMSAEQVGTSTTTGLFARPTAAVFTTGGHYQVDLEPGWHLVTATSSGKVCGEFQVDVAPGTTITVDFTCSGIPEP
jgi:hypothetical protein